MTKYKPTELSLYSCLRYLPGKVSDKILARVFECLVECHNFALHYPAETFNSQKNTESILQEPFLLYVLPLLSIPVEKSFFRELLETAFIAGNFSWSQDPAVRLFALITDILLNNLGNPARFDEQAFFSLTMTFSNVLQTDKRFYDKFTKLYSIALRKMDVIKKEIQQTKAVEFPELQKKPVKEVEVKKKTVNVTAAGKLLDMNLFNDDEDEKSAAALRYRITLRQKIIHLASLPQDDSFQ